MKGTKMNPLPVVVIGAGPIGLAAAAELRERGLTPLVFERGTTAGAAISEWNHVRLFSRWSELVSPARAATPRPEWMELTRRADLSDRPAMARALPRTTRLGPRRPGPVRHRGDRRSSTRT
ncbi:FAD-dependent oxidoreductase [Rhodococcus sp. OAS809]|uniref:FAD-dependent oxidoreductase n=1 Tax=Rhodococcus sp. OAS809 TaxID=2663874 RepID=UPI003394B634